MLIRAVQFSALASLALWPVIAFSGDGVSHVENQTVAQVNAEAISKRDVEARMNGIAEEIESKRRIFHLRDTLDPATDAELTRLYLDAFREALRIVVRERLMLQHFKLEKMSIDEQAFQKRLADFKQRLREQRIPFDPDKDTRRLREIMMLEVFRAVKFDSLLDAPKRREVEAFYRAHIERYPLKAAVKIRIIKINLSIEDKVTGKRTARENPYEIAETLLSDITSGAISFIDAARTRNDDADLRANDGLLKGPNDNGFIVPESYKPLAEATRDLKEGEVCKAPFEFGEGYAIAMVESRRGTATAPLEGKVYDAVYNEAAAAKRAKMEDEWFRAELAKALVLQVVEGTSRPLPLDFFFPDDAKKADLNSRTEGRRP
ncbi:MAG TPA: peptidyl-prolyl cis-trans isomerase [Planctomycetota bacterium]|nr:peptidyl-prolyl cis-trans isomerase [Planctomycetota bacterium]